MDESWRMRMGMPTPPSPPPTRYQFPRSSAASHRREPISDDHLNPEDFTDVFGGPPRTILSHQFSTSYPRSSSSSTSYFYEEIFRPQSKAEAPARRSGRSLPEFTIPGQQKRDKNGFYSDIFGSEDERVVRSRSRSKTSSSSVLSSEELSPLRPVFYGGPDDDVSSFASKLRPINVKSRWNSRRTVNDDQFRHQKLIPPPFSTNQDLHTTDNLKSYYPFGISRRNASPETISLEPISNGSFRVSADDLELKSPSSAVSSVCHSLGQEGKGHVLEEDEVLRPDDLEQDEDEVMSSYVIEINSENREGPCESNGVDEAIAWAKEKFHSECEAEKTIQDVLKGNEVSEGHTDSFGSLDNQQLKWEIVEDEELPECTVQREMELLDEKIRLWSSGKEADIRLLLSSLHHILWPNSGWLPAPLANIIDSSQVKKAYQRARLCLHPDKLQQRGATLQQKYVAEKAFSIIQDAWAAFFPLDVF